MSGTLSLHAGEVSAEELACLEASVAAREGELASLRAELLALQNRYLAEIGVLYSDLGRLESELRDAEIRAGLRLPEDIDTEDSDEEAGTAAAVCVNGSGSSEDLKRVFRDVAKAVHPDLALDEMARCRRHSLMAEANRAYADRDADRLRLILQAFEEEAATLPEEGDWRIRSSRRAARLRDRLAHLEHERSGLEQSAIARLQRKIGEARAQGWDLWAEMLQQVRRDISATSARIAKLRLLRT
jgi:hypothetical protein